jgi:hypothetical protein
MPVQRLTRHSADNEIIYSPDGIASAKASFSQSEDSPYPPANILPPKKRNPGQDCNPTPDLI